MKRIIFGIILVILMMPDAAQAYSYSENSNVRAHLSRGIHCGEAQTIREVYLINETNKPRMYRSFIVSNGVKTSDSRWTVPAHSKTGLIYYLNPGEGSWVTITYRTEVILHRYVKGICY